MHERRAKPGAAEGATERSDGACPGGLAPGLRIVLNREAFGLRLHPEVECSPPRRLLILVCGRQLRKVLASLGGWSQICTLSNYYSFRGSLQSLFILTLLILFSLVFPLVTPQMAYRDLYGAYRDLYGVAVDLYACP